MPTTAIRPTSSTESSDQGNLTPVEESSVTEEANPMTDNDDPDGLQFEGTFIPSAIDGVWVTPIDQLECERNDVPVVGATFETFNNIDEVTLSYYCKECNQPGQYMNKCDCEGIFCKEEASSNNEDRSNADSHISFQDLCLMPVIHDYPPTYIMLKEYLIPCGYHSKSTDTHMCNDDYFNFGFCKDKCDFELCTGTYNQEVDYNYDTDITALAQLPQSVPSASSSINPNLDQLVINSSKEDHPSTSSSVSLDNDKSKTRSSYLPCYKVHFDAMDKLSFDPFSECIELEPSFKNSVPSISLANTPISDTSEPPTTSQTLDLLSPVKAAFFTDAPTCRPCDIPSAAHPTLTTSAPSAAPTDFPSATSYISDDSSSFRATKSSQIYTHLSTWLSYLSHLSWTSLLFCSSLFGDSLSLFFMSARPHKLQLLKPSLRTF